MLRKTLPTHHSVILYDVISRDRKSQIAQATQRLLAKAAQVCGYGRIHPSDSVSTFALLMEAPEKIVTEIFTYDLFLHYAQLGGAERQLVSERWLALLDTANENLFVNPRQCPAQKRFTIGHEIGHIALHANMAHSPVIFREDWDDPRLKPPIEEEADYAASCLLMPERTIRAAFAQRFFDEPFDRRDNFRGKPSSKEQSQRIADKLAAEDWESYHRKRSCRNRRKICAERCAKYLPTDGSLSLAGLFGVSEKAMAIRLRELRLY